MLYERWREVAKSCSDLIAVLETQSGRSWTFSQLARAAETQSEPPGEREYAQGGSVEFVLSVLRGWRWRKIVCPLEPEQVPFELGPGLPPGIVHLKSTSASTGAPRLVAFTAEQLAADAANIVATMGLRPDWPNLGIISLAHSYGFSNLVLPLLLHGIPLVLGGAAFPEALRRAAAGHPALTLAAVPALWRTWEDAAAIPSNIRLAISAGAPLPIALEERIFQNRGLKIHNFYGSSECGGIAYDRTQTPRQDAACVGSPMENVRVSIDEEGCVQVQSEAVGQTYWPEPAEELGGGVFLTSDLGELRDGCVYLRGRASDQINVAGRKVSPEIIERALMTHPQVSECLVFGVHMAEVGRGDTIVACLTPKTAVTPEALKQFLMTRLPAWQVPREWWFVEGLHANGRGKLSRAHWRRNYLAVERHG